MKYIPKILAALLIISIFGLFLDVNAVEINSVGPAGTTASDYDYIQTLQPNGQRVVRDINNVLHAVYYRDTGVVTQIIYSRSNDNGVTWVNQTIAASTAGVDVVFNPTVAVLNGVAGANVGVFVVFSRWTIAGATNLFVMNGTGNAPPSTITTFGAATNISSQLTGGYTAPSGAEARAYDNFLFIDSNGLVHLAWSEYNGADHRIFHARSNNGTTWTNTPTIFNSVGGEVNSDRHPRLTQDALGNVQLVWMGQRSNADANSYPNGGIVYFATRAPGFAGAWGAATNYDTGNHMRYPDITYDTVNNRHLTWTEGVGVNDTVMYRENAGANISVSATNAQLKTPMLSLTTNDVPVIMFFSGTAGVPATFGFYSSSKLSPTQWRSPVLTQTPTLGRRNGFIIPRISNDILSAIWFVTLTGDPDQYETRYAEDTDRINPYISAAPTGLLDAAIFGTCAGDNQQIFASMAAMPAGATQVQFELFNIANVSQGTSPWQATLSHTFTNVPDSDSYYIVIRSRDAVPNQSVDSPQSATIVVGDDTSACITFDILQPPLAPAPAVTCGLNNFVSARWNAIDPFEVATLAFFADTDQALPMVNPINPSPLVALTENGSFGSAIFDVTALANGNYFFGGQMTGALIGTANDWGTPAPSAFTINSALNEVPVVNITAPALPNQLPTNGIYAINYQWADTVAPGSTITFYADADTTFGNGNEVLLGNTGALPIGAGVQNGTFNWDVTNAAGPTNYIYASIDDGQCASNIYSAGTVFVAIANNFGQRIFNFPNPFSPMTANPYQSTTNIVINLDAASDVDLYIFNTHGEQIYRQNITGVVGRFPNFVWNGRDSRGNIVPNGVYIMKAMVRNTKEVYTGRMSVLDK